MSENKRKIFTGAQKDKVDLEAVRGAKTINAQRDPDRFYAASPERAEEIGTEDGTGLA